MSKINREQILKLARLSKIELTDEEVEKYQTELSEILDYVELLDSVDVSGLKPTYQVSGKTNAVRADEVIRLQASPDELKNILPDSQGRYIKVGRMI